MPLNDDDDNFCNVPYWHTGYYISPPYNFTIIVLPTYFPTLYDSIVSLHVLWLCLFARRPIEEDQIAWRNELEFNDQDPLSHQPPVPHSLHRIQHWP